MKNNCKYSEDIYLYLNDELDSNKKEELMEHLKVCKECEEEFKFLDSMERELKNFEEVELPDDFKEKLHKKLVASKNETKVFKIENYAKGINRFISVAAAVVLLAVFTRVVYLYNNTFNQSKGLSNMTNNSLESLSTALKDEAPSNRLEKSNVDKTKEADGIYAQKNAANDVSAIMSDGNNNDETKSSSLKNNKGLTEQERIQSKEDSLDGSIEKKSRSNQPSNNKNLYSAVSEPRTNKDDITSNTGETKNTEITQNAKSFEDKPTTNSDNNLFKLLPNDSGYRSRTGNVKSGNVNGTKNENFNEVSFETIEKNDNEGLFREKKNYVITENKEWEDLWNKAVASEITVPKIDFEQSMVIAVFQGLKNTAGYRIEIYKVIEKDNSIEVYIQEASPASDNIVTQVITSPYHIVKIKKTDKEVKLIYNNE